MEHFYKPNALCAFGAKGTKWNIRAEIKKKKPVFQMWTNFKNVFEQEPLGFEIDVDLVQDQFLLCNV